MNHEDEDLETNISWKMKKSSGETDERVTLKVDIKKAVKYDAKKKNNPQRSSFSNISDMPSGLKKIRKKIKDAFDDEDDEDENDFQITGDAGSLLNALSEEEKRVLQQKENFKQANMLKEAGKMGAAQAVKNSIAAPAKASIKNMQAMGISNQEILEATLSKEEIKFVKGRGKKLSDRELISFLRGIKKVKSMAGFDAIEGLKVKELVEAGTEKEEDRIAKLILEKSGRRSKKKKLLIAKKMEKNKALQKHVLQRLRDDRQRQNVKGRS